MKVVLDTNVLVSAVLQPLGPPAEVVRLAVGGAVVPCYDARMLMEYRAVLLRPRFALHPKAVQELLDQIVAGGFLAMPPPLKRALPDPADETFLAVALAARAECLITGNVRHFPASLAGGTRVLTPSVFLALRRT